MYAENKDRQRSSDNHSLVNSMHMPHKVGILSNSSLLSCIMQRMYIRDDEFKVASKFLAKYEDTLNALLYNDDTLLGTLGQILEETSSEMIKDPRTYIKNKMDGVVSLVCNSGRHFYSIEAVADEVKKGIIKSAAQGKGKGNDDRPSIYPGKAARGSSALTRAFMVTGSLGHSLHHHIPYPKLKKEAERLEEILKNQKSELERLKQELTMRSNSSLKEITQKNIESLQAEYDKSRGQSKELSKRKKMLAEHGVTTESSEVHAWKPDNLVYGPNSSDRIYDPGSHLDYEAGLILNSKNTDYMEFALEKNADPKAKKSTVNRKSAKKPKNTMNVQIHTETKENYMKTNLLEQIYEECFVLINKPVHQNNDFSALSLPVNGCIPRFSNIEVDKSFIVPVLIQCREILRQETIKAAKKIETIKYLLSKIEVLSDESHESTELKIPDPKVHSKRTTVTLNGAKYIVEDTRGDGNCFFHAYRALSADRRSIDELRALLPASSPARQSNVWVNEMDIYNFTQAAQIRIEMYTQIGIQIKPAGVFGSNGQVYRILHVNGNHFVALKPV